MRKINKTILLLFALVLSLSVTVGATVAYFSDYEQASGGATLQLGGKTELYEGSDENQKDIVITNTGETDMIVRVGIYGPDGMVHLEKDNDLWIDGANGMYYYSRVLKPGEKTFEGDVDKTDGNLVASMSYHWDGDVSDYYFEVTVVHEGSQAIYEGTKLKVPKGWDPAAVAKIKIPASQ